MLISVLAEHGIEQVSFSIYRPIQISPVTTHLDVGFIQIPGDSSLATTFGAKILTDQWRKSKLPGPYCLVADLKSTLQKKFRDITKTELVSQTPENGEQYDVSRKMEIVERGPGSFVETPIAVSAVGMSGDQAKSGAFSWVWTLMDSTGRT